jgi:hypothetical protein
MCHQYQRDCVHDTFEKFGSSRFVRCCLNSHVNARRCQDTTAIPGRNETLTFMKVLHMYIAAVLPTSPSCSVCPRPFAFSYTIPMRASRFVHPLRNTHLPTPCSLQKRRTNPGVSKQKSVPICLVRVLILLSSLSIIEPSDLPHPSYPTS